MIGFLRKVTVATLKASGRPELQEVAAWLEDAEAEAVQAIASVITRAMRGDARLSDSAAAEVLQLRNSAAAKPSVERNRSAHPFLDEYAVALQTVVDLGSWRTHLALRGFVHTADCASYWKFDPVQVSRVEVSTLGSEAFITFDSTCEVYLGEAVGEPELRRINEELGRPGTSLPKIPQRVRSIEEHRIQVDSGPKTMDLPVDTVNWSGLAAMAESLPIALEARGGSLGRLRSIVGSQISS